eukprot:686255-Pelagomonas_calceolata.AAC.3
MHVNQAHAPFFFLTLPATCCCGACHASTPHHTSCLADAHVPHRYLHIAIASSTLPAFPELGEAQDMEMEKRKQDAPCAVLGVNAYPPCLPHRGPSF